MEASTLLIFAVGLFTLGVIAALFDLVIVKGLVARILALIWLTIVVALFVTSGIIKTKEMSQLRADCEAAGGVLAKHYDSNEPFCARAWGQMGKGE